MKKKRLKKLSAVRAELKRFRKQLQSILDRINDLGIILEPAAACVDLLPGDCYTFGSAPTGKITITNDTDDHGTIEFHWGEDTFSGEVQATSTRTMNPVVWPATACNTGAVPLQVCSA